MSEFEELAEIAQLRRIRAKLDVAHGVATAPGDPGPLLDWIPDVSPGLRAPTHLAPFTETVEASLHGPVNETLSAPIRHGKPIREDSLITMVDGSRRPIREIRIGDAVISGEGRRTFVTGVWDQGELDVLRIETAHGRVLFAEGTHRLLARRKVENRKGGRATRSPVGPRHEVAWVEAGLLRAHARGVVGDRHSIATRANPDRATSSIGGESIARFLGYIIGDGGVTQRGVNWTNADPVVRERFMESARAIHPSVSFRAVDPLTIAVRSPAPAMSRDERRARQAACERARRRGRRGRHNHRPTGPVVALLRRHDVMGHGAHTKRVPRALFSAPDNEIAAFIAAYFECDGTRAARRPDGRAGGNSSITSVSRGLLCDVQTLLSWLGIRSSVHARHAKYKGRPHLSWNLTVLDDARFFDLIPVVGKKAGPSDRSRRYEPTDNNLWDPVVAVEPAGRARCLCITVDRDESFLANDIVTHNTTTIVHAIVWLLAAYMLLGIGPPSIAYVTSAHQRALEVAKQVWRLCRAVGHTFPTKGLAYDKTTATGARVKLGGIFGSWIGDGFTHIICDDLHKNRAEAESRLKREGTIEALENDILTRTDQRGTSTWVIGARWNVNDVVGAMGKRPIPHHHTNLPALGAKDVPLAPWLMSRERLIELRENVGPYVFASLLQGEPRPRGGALFIDTTLTKRLPVDGVFRTAIGIDLSRTSRTRSDPNAAVVLRRHMTAKPSRYDVLKAVKHRGTMTDRVREEGADAIDLGFVRALAVLVREHPDAPIVMYAAESERWLVQLIGKLLLEALGTKFGPRIVLLPIVSRDKFMRAQAFAAAWNTGRVVVEEPKDRDAWQNDYVQQHVEFTGQAGNEDDLVDAGTAAFDYLAAIGTGGGGTPQTTGEGSEADRLGRYV